MRHNILPTDIRIIVLGVGKDLTESYLSCLLQDPDTDYIPVQDYNYNDFKKILPELQQITCPVNYDMKITEVKARPDSSQEFGSRFVEIWNTGSTVNLDEIQVNGLVTGSLPQQQLKQSQYLVLYKNGDRFKNVTCIDCNCNPSFNGDKLNPAMYQCQNSLYIACDGTYCDFANTTNTDWFVQINDTSNTNVIIDQVKYDSNTWPSIIEGYTYKLKGVGFNNQLGGNWEQSCYTFGTPGDPPINCTFSNCTTYEYIYLYIY